MAGPSGPAFLYNFYPRSPCGERRGTLSDTSDVTAISIHALLAESDLTDDVSAGGKIISIHALLAESDLGRGEVV